jgi:hypothetical protein
LIIWNPNGVSTTSETPSTSRANAAAEKALAMVSKVNLSSVTDLGLAWTIRVFSSNGGEIFSFVYYMRSKRIGPCLGFFLGTG